MKTTTKARKTRTFAPAAWQWDPQSVTDAGIAIQVWSAGGCLMRNVGADEARKLVAARAFFAGSCIHVCQVHDGIDGRNALA